jgi:4-hydroxyphenylpyruvate dioxygenase
MDYLSWSRHYRNFPGQGDLPINDFIKALLSTGYDGLLSLEIFNDQFRAGSPRSVAIDGHRSLIYMLDQQQQEETAGRQRQPRLPARSRCLGTEFIEFAIDEESAVDLEALLSGIGFSKTGEHVSKSVSRWNQGDINIVVNTEKEGFAHSYNIVHGTSVCAIALKVEDAAATLDRARKLLEQPFRQAVGPGELEIPAVRGLGGSLVYFTDAKSKLARVWDVDFAQLGGTSLSAGAGLTTVDHISQSMHYQEMLTWLLFYGSLLDVAKLPEQDILDPGGLVKSQVLQSGDGAIRLILNASQSAQTLSSRFLSEAFGSGVQHIAFASRDIFATAERLASNGVALLPIPENYYDDLEAKTDLSSDDVERLKARSILYERDGDAEYLQLYTQTFANRFFFEIVERRGGYKGFGASNAQIRLAAQARLSPIAL